MSDEDQRQQNKTPYSQCLCGNKENESKDIANAAVKAFLCPACSRTWEVPMAQVHAVEGY